MHRNSNQLPPPRIPHQRWFHLFHWLHNPQRSSRPNRTARESGAKVRRSPSAAPHDMRCNRKWFSFLRASPQGPAPSPRSSAMSGRNCLWVRSSRRRWERANKSGDAVAGGSRLFVRLSVAARLQQRRRVNNVICLKKAVRHPTWSLHVHRIRRRMRLRALQPTGRLTKVYCQRALTRNFPQTRSSWKSGLRSVLRSVFSSSLLWHQTPWQQKVISYNSLQ